jgi:hypothetical protein
LRIENCELEKEFEGGAPAGSWRGVELSSLFFFENANLQTAKHKHLTF